ncbi:hypothetical protein DL765_007803 [Monosporascus sp. GIB2]|nr:hypothetical protein DL765_007803 [Monosporascus sp. GIB2]
MVFQVQRIHIACHRTVNRRHTTIRTLTRLLLGPLVLQVPRCLRTPIPGLPAILGLLLLLDRPPLHIINGALIPRLTMTHTIPHRLMAILLPINITIRPVSPLKIGRTMTIKVHGVRRTPLMRCSLQFTQTGTQGHTDQVIERGGNRIRVMASPQPSATGKDEQVEHNSHDRQHVGSGYGSAAKSDASDDDLDWDYEKIFQEPSPRNKAHPLIPIAVPLPTEWVDKIPNPHLSGAVDIESKYITIDNVDDFSQSIRDTKEWAYMQYHPGLLETCDSHPNAIYKYQSALEAWTHSRNQHNRRGQITRRYKGRIDFNRHQGRSYNVDGYPHKTGGNGRYPNRQPEYGRHHGQWDRTPQQIDDLPEIGRHYASAESHGPHHRTQYAAGRFDASEPNGNGRWPGEKHSDADHSYRHKQDIHRKRRWAEVQDDSTGAPRQNRYAEFHGEPERDNKRYKHASPEPGEIPEELDYNDQRHTPIMKNKAMEGTIEQRIAKQSTTAATSIYDSALAPEPGEVVETGTRFDDVESHSSKTRNTLPAIDTSGRAHAKDTIYERINGAPNGQFNVTNRDDRDVPPRPGQASPQNRPISRQSSKSRWDGGRHNSRPNSRRSSLDDLHAQIDSPLTPRELELLGMNGASTDESDSEKEPPKRQFDDVTPKNRSHRTKVHEAYSRRCAGGCRSIIFKDRHTVPGFTCRMARARGRRGLCRTGVEWSHYDRVSPDEACALCELGPLIFGGALTAETCDEAAREEPVAGFSGCGSSDSEGDDDGTVDDEEDDAVEDEGSDVDSDDEDDWDEGASLESEEDSDDEEEEEEEDEDDEDNNDDDGENGGAELKMLP